ncbi:hypothetical protein [Geochorda subterranea]|uniref:Uncharacterized protein n=1 Tax=Geochorda subterranea TaxID=3109564 RepID=A0ABZ1BSC0_9FIRM|nr:hypothetical protein [Limnochorda sp. LNt]WRP15699.1 hypothetical protein VLY81_05970 [Limnochorda sp. LNt]
MAFGDPFLAVVRAYQERHMPGPEWSRSFRCKGVTQELSRVPTASFRAMVVCADLA